MMVLLLSTIIGATQVPTFGTAVDMVGVTITAVDERTGAPITDLEKNDFIVVQDGVAQQVVHFGKHDVPASVLVLIDASASVYRILPHIKDAAARLIRSLRPGDEVQVVQFAARYQELSDFTTDHEYAATSLEKGIVIDDLTMLYRALLVAVRSLELRSPGDTERRRILILLSDGENTTGFFSERLVLDYIWQSGVLCYIVHLTHQSLSAVDPETETSRFMERLAYESGGRLVSVPYFVPQGLASAYENIASELDVQYHLGYRSSSSESGWHDIGVMLRSRSGIRLRYRRGYYMPLRR